MIVKRVHFLNRCVQIKAFVVRYARVEGIVGNGFANEIVEERITVYVAERVRTAALTKTEHDRERGVRVIRAFEQEFVLYPTVVFGYARGIDVFNFKRIERVTADGVRYGDERARVGGVGYGVAVGIAARDIARLNPKGELRARTRLNRNGCGRSRFLRRTFVFVITVIVIVVYHQNFAMRLTVFVLAIAFAFLEIVRTGVRNGYFRAVCIFNER